MFGLIWIDNGWDNAMALGRMVPEQTVFDQLVPTHGPILFHVDDWYGMTEDLRSMSKLPEAPSSCPNNRYLRMYTKESS